MEEAPSQSGSGSSIRQNTSAYILLTYDAVCSGWKRLHNGALLAANHVSRRQQTFEVCCGMKRMEAPSQSGTGSRLFVLVLFFLLFEEERRYRKTCAKRGAGRSAT
jgi:hypothetical protein